MSRGQVDEISAKELTSKVNGTILVQINKSGVLHKRFS